MSKKARGKVKMEGDPHLPQGKHGMGIVNRKLKGPVSLLVHWAGWAALALGRSEGSLTGRTHHLWALQHRGARMDGRVEGKVRFCSRV